MAGRFPLYTDADVRGPLIRALKTAGWDVLRAIDAFPERTPDLTHFECAAALGRVLVTNDEDHEMTADQWYRDGRPFAGVIAWRQSVYGLSEYLRSLPSSIRTQEDIDRQIREERDAWS